MLKSMRRAATSCATEMIGAGKDEGTLVEIAAEIAASVRRYESPDLHREFDLYRPSVILPPFVRGQV
jgi:hypothetical protein